MTRAVRGAIGIEHNEKTEIYSAANQLIQGILSRNNIREADIISILFSVTKDLTKGNPATGLRSHKFAHTPLFCVQEAEIDGAVPRTLRVLVTYSTESAVTPGSALLGPGCGSAPGLDGGY